MAVCFGKPCPKNGIDLILTALIEQRRRELQAHFAAVYIVVMDSKVLVSKATTIVAMGAVVAHVHWPNIVVAFEKRRAIVAKPRNPVTIGRV